jgi:hypothetical protein
MPSSASSMTPCASRRKPIEQDKDGRQDGWGGAEARLDLYKKGSPYRTPPMARETADTPN